MAKLVLGCLVEPAFKGLLGGAGGRRRGGTPSGPSPMPDDAVHAPWGVGLCPSPGLSVTAPSPELPELLKLCLGQVAAPHRDLLPAFPVGGQAGAPYWQAEPPQQTGLTLSPWCGQSSSISRWTMTVSVWPPGCACPVFPSRAFSSPSTRKALTLSTGQGQGALEAPVSGPQGGL